LRLTSPAAGCTVGSVVVPGAPLPANSFVHSLAGVFGITVTDAMQATFLFRMFYIWLATSLVRFKYYMAWKLAEGLGFRHVTYFIALIRLQVHALPPG
jgi:hypothetical protein